MIELSSFKLRLGEGLYPSERAKPPEKHAAVTGLALSEGYKPLFFGHFNYTVERMGYMAGHTNRHPYLKSYDELSRTQNRLKLYLDMHWEIIPDDEKESIQIMLEKIGTALRQVPEKYRVSRWNQFKKD